MKHQRLTQSGCKDIVIIQFKFYFFLIPTFPNNKLLLYVFLINDLRFQMLLFRKYFFVHYFSSFKKLNFGLIGSKVISLNIYHGHTQATQSTDKANNYKGLENLYD